MTDDCYTKPNITIDRKIRNETATWLHVYQMGPPPSFGGGGIQCDGSITGGVPIT